MKNIGKFEKVSYLEFEQTAEKYMGISKIHRYSNPNTYAKIKTFYDTLKTPIRKTKNSAGYDFYFPYSDTWLYPDQEIEFYTGIKVKIRNGWFLGLFPKSGISFKYKLRLIDTISVIDGDYYNTDHEGNICVKLKNCGELPFQIKNNEPIIQGVFMQYGLTTDDYTTETRTGGLGSTYNLD